MFLRKNFKFKNDEIFQPIEFITHSPLRDIDTAEGFEPILGCTSCLTDDVYSKKTTLSIGEK
ncbi:hypothetical protein ABT44_08505 [Brucella melitensis]|nr:hypothetical protein ABT44_08505 [Brucella melitensis]